jgi:hypothetical protein
VSRLRLAALCERPPKRRLWVPTEATGRKRNQTRHSNVSHYAVQYKGPMHMVLLITVVGLAIQISAGAAYPTAPPAFFLDAR